MYVHISIYEYTHTGTLFVAEEWGDQISAMSDRQHGEPGALAVQSWRSPAAPGTSPQLQEQAHSSARPSPGGDKVTPVELC